MAETVGHVTSARGELHLRRCDDGHLELRVNGVFVMDDRETSTERLLASQALAQHRGNDLRVCIGGLGLGFTLAEALADPRVRHVDVVEIEEPLVAWHRDGTLTTAGDALADPRTQVVGADIHDHVHETPDAAYDLVLLDVDNGPGYLVHDHNERVYAHDFLVDCRRVLAPDGLLVVWSASDEPALVDAMTEVFGTCEPVAVPVTLGERTSTYHLFTGTA